jgi:hypothetical protein
MKTRAWMMTAAFAAALLATSACQRTPVVSYQKDVVPILDQHCKVCHLPGQPGYVASGPGSGRSCCPATRSPACS